MEDVLLRCLQGLSLAGSVLVVLLWWPLRKTDALRAVPWYLAIVALGLLSSFSHQAMIAKYGTDIFKNGIFAFFILGGKACIWAIAIFFCYVLVAANVAFVLDRIGYSAPIITGLKSLYGIRAVLGWCMVSAGLAAAGICWVFLFFFPNCGKGGLF